MQSQSQKSFASRVLKRAWVIAKEAATKYNAKALHFIKEAMKQAYQEYKDSIEWTKSLILTITQESLKSPSHILSESYTIKGVTSNNYQIKKLLETIRILNATNQSYLINKKTYESFIKYSTTKQTHNGVEYDSIEIIHNQQNIVKRLNFTKIINILFNESSIMLMTSINTTNQNKFTTLLDNTPKQPVKPTNFISKKYKGISGGYAYSSGRYCPIL